MDEDFEVIKHITRLKSKGNIQKVYKVVKIILSGKKEELWFKLIQLKEKTLDKENIAIHLINGITQDSLRKITAEVFKGQDNKITIYTLKQT